MNVTRSFHGGGSQDLIQPTVPDHFQFRPGFGGGEYIRFAQIKALF